MKAFAIANLEAPPDAAFFDRVARLAAAHVDWVLLRDKGLDDAVRYRTAERCRGLVAPPSRLLVHGRADIARAVGADGVHLASDGLPGPLVRELVAGAVVGRSCHSVADCAAAAREGLDYALLGPVFPPRSKVADSRISRTDLARAATLGIEIYALGGISRDTLEMLKSIPLAGVAAVTLFMADEPLETIVAAIHSA
jgi:thiamine-phosphate pyrophosphorylase